MFGASDLLQKTCAKNIIPWPVLEAKFLGKKMAAKPMLAANVEAMNGQGFDVVIVCTGNAFQAKFWQQRLEADARGEVSETLWRRSEREPIKGDDLERAHEGMVLWRQAHAEDLRHGEDDLEVGDAQLELGEHTEAKKELRDSLAQ